MLLHLDYHFLDHLFHFFDLGRDLDDIVLHFRVLENTFGAEHGSVVLTVELNLLGGMNVAVPD